ncbi:MAG: GtrA family protein [Rickettsiales bacterium]|nr:GtrA family protein [Rickettsiales bacterium]
MDFIVDLAKQIKNHPASKQLIRFLIIGTIGTIISYSTFLILLNILHIHYLISNALAFIVGVAFGYYFNSKWSFNSQNAKLFHRYFTFYLTSLALSTIILKIIVELFQIIPEIANLMTIFIVTYYNFFGVKLWVFKK